MSEVEMINRSALHDELTDAFIRYQWRQENPMHSSEDTMENMVMKYRRDVVFHNKVCSLVSGVMQIMNKHCVITAEGVSR